jgi:radical SAM superfamily enzyme YgiQ (UPF0313 family)
MKRRIYLINPAPDFPSYFNTEVVAEVTGRPTAHVIALALPTVAAMLPPEFEAEICDENISPVDFDHPAEFVGLTGMVSQWDRMKEIAAEFRTRGKIVLIGGPQATLRPDTVRSHCDILVRGEIEGIADELFADLLAGTWQAEYSGGRPDITDSPLPRLDLYPNDRTIGGAIQTCRGCPFNCEFCDVIQYQGRKQRHKAPARVVAELEQLHAVGYRHVFITDDNMTANRRKAKAILTAIRDWNRAQEEPLEFATQLSIDVARDDEMLQLLSDAGISEVFIGIETPNPGSLREAGKFHNNVAQMHQQIERFVRAGISVMGGMIVGFDADGPDIFQRQYDFAMSLPIPIFTAVTLMALETTPLYARLQKEGRVICTSAELPCTPWDTNIVPKQMSREDLVAGLQWLCNRLYAPEAFAERVRNFAAKAARARRMRNPKNFKSTRPVEKDMLMLLKRLPRMGWPEAKMALTLAGLMLRYRSVASTVSTFLLMYMQIRHMFDRGNFWNRDLGRCPEPAPQHAEAMRMAG